MQIVAVPLLLGMMLFANMMSNTSIVQASPHMAQSTIAPPPPATNTLAKFLSTTNGGKGNHGPFQFPSQVPAALPNNSTTPPAPLPSVEPPKMQPLTLALDSSQVAVSIPGVTLAHAAAPAKLLASGASDLQGSDGRLEVQVPAKDFDLSAAARLDGLTVVPPLSLQITQLHGHYTASSSLLGFYQVRVLDSQNKPLLGVHLLSPLTFLYHYQPGELEALGLDPDHLMLSWPDALMQARAAGQTEAGLVVPLVNDPTTHTLSAQVSTLGIGRSLASTAAHSNPHATLGAQAATGTIEPSTVALGGDQALQTAPTPHLAEVSGNSGGLTYQYPLSVAPGPPHLTPLLTLNYSSQSTNERHSRTAPADQVGDGFSLSLGSITATNYPSSSAAAGTWYFLNLPSGAGDRLLSTDGVNFVTEHTLYDKIQIVTVNGQPCFHVWDPSYTYYEFGCTSDSLEYRTDSTGRQNYQWNLDKIQPANEGPNTVPGTISYSYLQDMVTIGGFTSVRDAAIKQITYGATSAPLAGTVDFFYRAPFTASPWTTAYGTNYHCSSAPPASTTLRCDDPIDHPTGFAAPTVMSTFSLQTVVSYLGDDSSASHKFASYDLQYEDDVFTQGWDGITQIQEYQAGNHLLTRITPAIYQNGTAHAQPGASFSYSGSLTDNYADPSHTFNNGAEFTAQTFWRYLTSYRDGPLGTGETISYQTAHNNTDGTPNGSDGTDRYDPTYCDNHSDCTGSYTNVDRVAWSAQIVTAITQVGQDSSSSSLTPATTQYHYRLAKVGTGCTPAGSDSDCVGDTFSPRRDTGLADGDWQDYYHSEFRGFNVVYITKPSSDLVAQYYFSTFGLWTNQGASQNYLGGQLYQEDHYWGTQLLDGNLITRQVNQYANQPGFASQHNACNGNFSGVYTPCEAVLLSSVTTDNEGAGTSNPNIPRIEHDYTYDDYNTTNGLIGGYHNLLQEVISSSNAPTITKKWTYQSNNQVVNGWTYYNVRNVVHSEVDDASGHVWNCQDIIYDEGRASGVPAPAASWPTTVTSHSDCSNPTSSALTSYTGYDSVGNVVATVDPLGVANPSLYNGASGQRFNQQGTALYWGFNSGSGDTPTGEMHSQTVTLGGNGQVNFLIGGGNDINNLYVALIRASDGAELFRATGPSTETMQRVTWDASAHIGTQVYLKVVDNATGIWGHINLDDVHIAGASLPNADFEQGNLSGWIVVSGTAFQDINVTSKVTANNGCALSTAPAYITSAWSGTRWYATCTTYDSYQVRPTSTSNAIAQSSSTSYDDTQGGLPVSATDANGQTSTLSYSYDSNGNPTVQAKSPGEPGSFTRQSQSVSHCTTSSALPCYEIDTSSAQYPGAVTRTFYDQQGRAVETRTPLDSTHDLVSYTLYEDSLALKFTSLPFRVAAGSSWIDPNGATDDTGATPGGTTTEFDPLGRVVGVRDPLYGSTGEPGVSCQSLGGFSGTWTTCQFYAPDTASGQNSCPNLSICYYSSTLTVNANGQMSEVAQDGLGHTIQQQFYDAATTTAHITSYTHTQYNAIGNPTSVQQVDLAPQAGQTVTSVTATATYDDLGRVTSSTDPDRGNHSYTYDADGRVLTDISGTRTLGMSYDQLGRAGCVQDAAPTTNGYGGCSSSAHPLMQYAYDVTTLGTSGSSDFSIGQMTHSVATTYYPDGSAATTTQQMQHDQRGRLTSATLQLGVPSSWNVTTALPTYQENVSYNDANQLTTTQTTVGGQAGYTFSQAYDSTTGLLTGLSNNTTGTANLATVGYDAQGDVSDINFQTTTGTALANDHFTYDGNLRPATASATWQSGSGSSGTIFSQGRSYDPLGNVASISTTLAAVPGQSGSGGSETQNFCYDEQNRLVWAGNSGTQPAPGNGTCGSGTLSNSLGGATYSTSYSYTHLGQTWQGPLNGTGSYQYLYCNSSHPHQLTGLYPTGTSCSNLTGAVYTSSNDAWGNVTNRVYNGTNATLSYDQLDHLVQWNAGATSQEWYAYDMGGNRTLRRSTTGSGTSITVYAFGLEEHIYSSTGTPQSSTFYYSLGGRLIGELQGSTTQFFLTDALGSVLTTFNATAGSAAVQGNQLYGPYGTSRYSQGTMGTNKGFTGQYADATGLDYYNARYYDPVVGQFLSADMVQGNMQGMNPYGYVGGNPETLTDPTGQRVACGNTCGSGGPPNQNDCNADPSLSGCQPFVPPPPDIPSLIPGNGSGDSLCPTGATTASCMGITTATQQHVQGTITVKMPIRGSGDGGIVCAGEGFCTNMPFSSGDITTDTTINVQGTAVNPFTFCFGGSSCDLLGDMAAGGDDTQQGQACSFTSETPVSTEQGPQAIGSLKVGEKVLAYNPVTKKMEYQPIKHVWINHDNDLVDLTLTTAKPAKDGKGEEHTNEVLHTNQKHPFFTMEKGFLPVGEIKVGMHVLRADGSIGEVTRWKTVPGVQTMYNLEVAQDHTFTVGEGQWVVHNCGRKTTDLFERYGSQDEALVAQDTGQLSFKPGTRGPDGGTKWISLPGRANPRKLGSFKSYAWLMEIETLPGTLEWLKSKGIGPGMVKANEPYFIGIPKELLGDFNARIINITISRVR
ncbi:MAG TPA: RHS repeat-associated core domain-containing protein [Ktedonosporobacter sp.]|jgi:RHS repeat-associated protein|nr:RHS repeat-associated core domain-containing protein [Ktedonosporobacter sp.]